LIVFVIENRPKKIAWQIVRWVGIVIIAGIAKDRKGKLGISSRKYFGFWNPT